MARVTSGPPFRPELANIYLHARYYDAALGIFLRPDPIGADSNTYRYAGGDPVNRSDPSGLWWACGASNDHWTDNGDGNLTPAGKWTTQCVWVPSASDFVMPGSPIWDYFYLGASPDPPNGRGRHDPCSLNPERCNNNPDDCSVNPDLPKCKGLPKDDCETNPTKEGCNGSVTTTVNGHPDTLVQPPGRPGEEPWRPPDYLGEYLAQISSPSCLNLMSQFVSNQRQWDGGLADPNLQRAYAAVNFLDNAKGAYEVNRTLGRAAVRVAAEAYFGLKVLVADLLGGAMLGNGARAVGDHAACTPRR